MTSRARWSLSGTLRKLRRWYQRKASHTVLLVPFFKRLYAVEVELAVIFASRFIARLLFVRAWVLVYAYARFIIDARFSVHLQPHTKARRIANASARSPDSIHVPLIFTNQIPLIRFTLYLFALLALSCLHFKYISLHDYRLALFDDFMIIFIFLPLFSIYYSNRLFL